MSNNKKLTILLMGTYDSACLWNRVPGDLKKDFNFNKLNISQIFLLTRVTNNNYNNFFNYINTIKSSKSAVLAGVPGEAQKGGPEGVFFDPFF
jgi:hypothetical protein